MGVVIGIVVAGAALFFWGFASSPAPLGVGLQANDNVEGCVAACANLRLKNAQTCAMRGAVAAARAGMVAAGTLLAAALATSLAAAAAVGAAAAIPIVGPLVAAGLAIIAFSYALYANFLTGRYAAAVAAYAVQSKGLADAMRLESDALALVFNSCPAEVATSCIASLPVCPV
jgi:hypothetical protein